MPFPPPPIVRDAVRLSALYGCGILNTPHEKAFDDITRLIAEICEVPVALVTLVDRDRQWFKAAVGTELRETPVEVSLCAHALLEAELLVVPDTRKDIRFVENPLVTGEPFLRFYAGALLRTPDGLALGTLCVLDTVPRTLTEKQINALRILAREVMTQIELRRRIKEQDTLIAQREAARSELVKVSNKHKRVAEVLQRSLLLTPPPSAFPGLEFAHFYEAARDEALIGGDFYDMFALQDNGVAFVVGDVTGKGLGAASYTAEVKFVLRSLLREGAAPADALSRLNRIVLEAKRLDGRAETEADVFVALLIAVVNPQTGMVCVSSAGGEPPLVLRRKTGNAPATVETLETAGLFIGADANAEYSEVNATLGEGDTLLLFSDGITEARKRPHFFGPEGIANAALGACETGQRVTPQGLGRVILEAAHTWTGGKLHDDVCLLAACLSGRNQNAQ